MTTNDGDELFVKVVGREQRDADALFKAWRALVYRELEDEAPFSTPKREIEHEAYLSRCSRSERVYARRRSCSRPTPARVTRCWPSDACRDGRSIPFPRTRSTTRCCARCGSRWAGCAARASRTATSGWPTCSSTRAAGRGSSTSALPKPRRAIGASAQDVAELLASLACLVGAKRAVASAVGSPRSPTRSRPRSPSSNRSRCRARPADQLKSHARSARRAAARDVRGARRHHRPSRAAHSHPAEIVRHRAGARRRGAPAAATGR